MAFGFATQYPNNTGPRPSFGSISLSMMGLKFVAFKSIEYARTRNREAVYGAHPDQLGKTLGENAYTGSCELYINEYVLFIRQLSLLLPDGYGDIFFPVNVQYNLGQNIFVTDTIEGCSIDETTASNSQGPPALTRKINLNPTKIKFDGLDDVTIPLTQVTLQLAA